MLRENPQARPNVYQALKEACAMQGREPPVKDVSDESLPGLAAANGLPSHRFTRGSRTLVDMRSLCQMPRSSRRHW